MWCFFGRPARKWWIRFVKGVEAILIWPSTSRESRDCIFLSKMLAKNRAVKCWIYNQKYQIFFMKFHYSQACEILIRGWLTLLFLTSHFRSDIVFTIEAYDQDGRWVIVHAVNLGLWIMIVMMVLQKLDYLKNTFFDDHITVW